MDDHEKYLRIIAMLFGINLNWCEMCNKEFPLKKVSTRTSFQCTKCYWQLSPLARTPFNKSTTHPKEICRLLKNIKHPDFNISAARRNMKTNYKATHRNYHLCKDLVLDVSIIPDELTMDFNIPVTPHQYYLNKQNARRYVSRHPEKVKEFKKANSKKMIERMPDRYIKSLLKIENVPQELIELKRAQLSLMRAAKSTTT